MNSHRRDLRRAAAQAFIQSLDQLEVSLVADPPPTSRGIQRKTQPSRKSPPPPVSLQDLEAAAADIEQYVQAMEALNETTQDNSSWLGSS